MAEPPRSTSQSQGDSQFAGVQAPAARISPMELDEFVAFVNAQGPQIAKRISKNDIEFEKQLTKKPPKA